jgi:hypothetical protein
MNKKYLLSAFAVLALVAVGCGNNDDDNNSSGVTAAAQRQMFCVSPNASNEPIQMSFSQDNSQVTVMLAQNGATPSPTPSASPSPTASATPAASPTPTMASAPDSINDLAAGVSLTFIRMDQASSATGGTTPSPTPSASPSPTASATPAASPTPVASATPAANEPVIYVLQGIPATAAGTMTSIQMDQALATGTGNGQAEIGGKTYDCSSNASVLNPNAEADAAAAGSIDH